MAVKTVEQLAVSLAVPVERLLQQMQETGLPQKKADDPVIDDEEQKLLAFLKRSHGETESAPKKITLKRRTLSTLKTSGGSGRGRTVNVEVRRKRTYVRRGSIERQDDTESNEIAAPTPVAKPAEAEISSISSDEARRRAAHEAEAEAKKLRQEATQKAAEAAEQKTQELAAEKAQKESQKETTGIKPEETEAETEETRISARKDKRDRHDLDEEDLQKKKSKHGSRKRRVEQLLGHEVEELIEEEIEELAPKGQLLYAWAYRGNQTQAGTTQDSQWSAQVYCTNTGHCTRSGTWRVYHRATAFSENVCESGGSDQSVIRYG